MASQTNQTRFRSRQLPCPAPALAAPALLQMMGLQLLKIYLAGDHPVMHFRLPDQNFFCLSEGGEQFIPSNRLKQILLYLIADRRLGIFKIVISAQDQNDGFNPNVPSSSASASIRRIPSMTGIRMSVMTISAGTAR